jgi:NDP-sugar pyrophosphorylase family protein
MDRLRLTITLRRDLIKVLDETIDGVQLRNRSHAIESIIAQTLAPKVTQAVILAGGQGVKMRPLTYEVPKLLIQVHGRPLIAYTLELLRENGIRDVIIATGHLGEKIQQLLGNGDKYGIKIAYSHEKKPLGTAGALSGAASLITNKPFLVINGDVLVKINLKEMIRFHEEEKFMVTMALTSTKETTGYGTVSLQGEKIVNFAGKEEPIISQLVNAGIYICSPNFLLYLKNNKKPNLDDVFPQLSKEGKLAGFTFEGDWFEISTPESYERALKKWQE